MSYNGSGTFLINTAGQPVVSGTVISSTAFNALTADLATGLSTAITKDGQTTVTANIPMGTYKFTGLGAGTAATDSANLSQVQSTVTKLLASVSGADTITAVGSPTLGAYAAGQMFYFIAAGDNTGAVTLNIDSLGAKSVTRDGSVALAAGDIKSGEVVVVVYDGTRFQVVSQINSSGNATFANVSITSALNVGGVSTLTGAVNIAGAVSIASSMSVVGVFTATGSSTLNGGVVINEPGADADTRIEGDTDANLVFVDASADKVGIGTSSPSVKLHVSATDSTGVSAIRLQNTTATTGNSWQITSSNSGVLQLATIPGVADYLTMSSSGNLGVGTTSPGTRLHVSGNSGDLVTVSGSAKSIYLNCDSGGGGIFTGTSQTRTAVYLHDTNDYVAFFTTSTERARINATGYWKASNNGVYVSSTANYHEIRQTAETTQTIQVTSAASGPFGMNLNFSAAAPNGTSNWFLNCDDTGAARATIRSNGGLANYQANDVNLSDERVKTDIKPVGSYWSKVKAIEIVTFKYKDQTHDDDNIGVIAQQVESVAPEFIDVDGFGETPEDGVPLKTVYTTDMYHAAIKALQEAMARIEQLEAKVAALETK